MGFYSFFSGISRVCCLICFYDDDDDDDDNNNESRWEKEKSREKEMVMYRCIKLKQMHNNYINPASVRYWLR